jgi:protein-S-isoprenylcysteine O-methyltransferase Ste14
MSKKLFIEAILKYLLGVILVGLLIFLPAGTINYLKGWIFMGILFVPMFIAGVVMMIKNPKLLKSRLDSKEVQGEQKLVIKLSGLMFIIGFILAGLDFRFNWLVIPSWISYASSVIFLVFYVMYGEVLRENATLLRTIKVEENQKVVDTGLYGIIRHPQYSASIVMFLTMPLILGSLISLAVFMVYPILIVLRIRNEEKVLTNELNGYKEYKEKVKYRLIPFIW